MKFNLIKTYTDVSYFSVEKNKFFYIDKFDNLFYQNKLVTNNTFAGDFCNNNILFYRNGKTIVYSNGKEIDELEAMININTFDGSSIICFTHTENGNKLYLYRFDCYHFQLEKEYEGFYPNLGRAIRLENDLICKLNNFEIKRLSLDTGKYCWELDLSGSYYTLGGRSYERTIINMIDVIDNQLYLWMDGELLLVLDVESGEILKEVYPLQQYIDEGILTSVLSPEYLKSEQTLFFFYRDFLIQFHLPTLTSKLVWQDSKYNIGPCDVTEKYIYFIGNYNKNDVFREYIGVFDREKNDVIWMEKVIDINEVNYNNLVKIKASEDKIYTLDTEKNLYVFQKDQ